MHLLSLKRLVMRKMLFVVVMAMILMGTGCGWNLHMAGVDIHHQQIGIVVITVVAVDVVVVAAGEECLGTLIIVC